MSLATIADMTVVIEIHFYCLPLFAVIVALFPSTKGTEVKRYARPSRRYGPRRR